MEYFTEMNVMLKSRNIPRQIEIMSRREFMDQYLVRIELKRLEKD